MIRQGLRRGGCLPPLSPSPVRHLGRVLLLLMAGFNELAPLASAGEVATQISFQGQPGRVPPSHPLSAP